MQRFSELFLEPEPGTIVAWVPLNQDSEPPEKWQICDGSIIESGDYEGKHTPDLRNKFLIGKNRDQVNNELAEQDKLTHTIDLAYSGTNLQEDNDYYNNDYNQERNIDNDNKMKTYNVVYIMRID